MFLNSVKNMLYCHHNNQSIYMHKYALLLVAFFLVSFAGTSLKKRISDENFRYEFYTTDKVVSPKEDRQYYWFKGGKIHNSEYGLAGELLHDDYLKFYHSNQLAESGAFKNGLKIGEWKTWFENGKLHSKTYWNKGQRDGESLVYDTTGNLVEEGNYKNDKKHGTWINYVEGDTLKYRKGELKVKKVKDTLKENKPGLFKRIFSKKEKDSLAVKQPKPEKVKESKQKKKTTKPGQDNKDKGNKESFFKRLFGKKDKNKDGNVKGT